MSREAVSIRKAKEVLRLRLVLGVLGLQQNQIASSCFIGQTTVHRYLEEAAAAGLTWPLPEDMDDHGPCPGACPRVTRRTWNGHPRG